MVPILSLNRSTDIWGPDANDFRPERSLDMDEKSISPENRCGDPYANLYDPCIEVTYRQLDRLSLGPIVVVDLWPVLGMIPVHR